ncbi:hypothetical protein IFM89_001656 [Coptis chinensis]|uniref:DUF4283 domain-containing protein n=1 Tax=Coptis chinensis TaxID=261450 RepID=A0A835LLU5_9MAGN|nr:hypothetical protein IFM89_001656 [Coptis chinensis]
MATPGSLPGSATSWSSMFSNPTTNFASGQLDWIETDMDLDVMDVLEEILMEGIEKWSNHIVGFFVDKRLPFPVVKRVLERTWETKAAYEIATDKELFYFKFQEEEDRQLVLETEPLFIAGRVFMLWTKKGINFITSRLGKPHCWDNATQMNLRLDYAKACVEVPISATYPDRLRFKLGGKEVVIVEYMWLPMICRVCNKLGHKEAKCPMKTNPVANETTNEEVRMDGVNTLLPPTVISPMMNGQGTNERNVVAQTTVLAHALLEVNQGPPQGNVMAQDLNGRNANSWAIITAMSPARETQRLNESNATPQYLAPTPTLAVESCILNAQRLHENISLSQAIVPFHDNEVVANTTIGVTLAQLHQTREEATKEKYRGFEAEHNQFQVLANNEEYLDDDISERRMIFSRIKVWSSRKEGPTEAKTRAQRRDNEEVTSPLSELVGKGKGTQNKNMKNAAGVSIQRMSSIESEPRTLSYDQIQYAREAALYVVNNKSSEEALSIFTEGMEQVMTSVGNEKRNLITEQDGDVEYQICRIQPGFMDSRDVASAPF